MCAEAKVGTVKTAWAEASSGGSVVPEQEGKVCNYCLDLFLV